MRNQSEQVMLAVVPEDHNVHLRADEFEFNWQQAAMQLDAYSNCRAIKLPGLVFHSLGENGRQYYIDRASFLLGNQAEFFKDALYPDRFWLCVGQELIDNFGFTIQQAPGQVLPVLYPVPPSPPLLMNGHIVPQYQLQAPELPIVAPDDVPHFTNAAPIDPSLPANDPPANADQFVDGPGVEAYQCADDLPVGAPQLAINPAPLDSHQFAISLPVEAPQYPAMPPSPIIATNQHAGPNEQAPQIPADPAPEEPAQPEGATNPRKRKASPDEDEDEEEDKDGDEEKQPKKKIKRPRNNWILFRMSENEKLQKEKPGSGVSYVSKEVRKRYLALPQAEKLYWKDLAAKEAAEHRRLYPNFKYSARRPRARRSSGE